ncbi:FAD-binding oxidoreductase [Actinoplanes sp. NBRC 101535]|uniref:FAD-binding oxidoreductase n=1 Tax=Actinoplanes sp. NBRC 101535 TaxID=3032196 RepID=UPI002556D0D9|nr:FAD-binding oxidoreductase [Actinoplanes sp. NBRC 101535]
MTDPLLDELVGICGPGFARPARSVDKVAGQDASLVAVPATARSAAAVLRLAAEHGLAVRARGAGSKIDWGRRPERVDLIIDTARLNGMWNHEGDTATVAAGTPVAAVQAALRLSGRRLATDPPSPRATVGGMLAVNESGPLRLRFASPAAQTVSVEYADSSGEVRDSDGEDGRPGIAEIDGVLTAAVLRLEELPAARRWIGCPVATPADVSELITRAVAEEWEPHGMEADLPGPGGGTFVLLFEGDETEVAARVKRVAAAWGGEPMTAPEPPPWWGRYPFGRGDVGLRIAARSRDLQAVAYSLRDIAGPTVAIRGSVGVGTLHAALPPETTANRVREIVSGLQQVLVGRRGRLAVVSAPPELAAEIEMIELRHLF